MRRSSLLGSVKSLFRSRQRTNLSQRRRRRAPEQRLIEPLEQRRVLAFDFVSAYVSADTPFFVAGSASADVLAEAPQQMTLRFTPNAIVNPATLGGISIVRSGGASDPFGNGGSFADINIAPGAILVDDLPSQNQIVIRFKEALPDDVYRITIGSGLQTVDGEAFRNGGSFSFDVRLSLGAQVVSVVPQPITRNANLSLSQSADSIVVHFDAAERLNLSSVETVANYALIEVDEASGADVAILRPSAVTYNSSAATAVLRFAADLPAGRTFRLEVGGPGIVGAARAVVGGAAGTSFSAAQDIGPLDRAGVVITGAITNRLTVSTPVGSLLIPTQPGPVEEPGHRDVPVDSGDHGIPQQLDLARSPIPVRAYNFQPTYGVSSTGSSYFNLITEEQKQRTREIFEIFSAVSGVRFVETVNQGYTIMTGDLRATGAPISNDSGVAGLGGSEGIVINSSMDWGASEYGGSWFQVAMHEIGHALGLDHSYDLPSLMGAPGSLPGDGVFPGDYDIVHLLQLFPKSGSDLDVYKFSLPATGRLSAETVVARAGQPALSSLDTVLSLYREAMVGGVPVRTLVARNDNSIGRDSLLDLDLEAGDYYVVVSSTGNTDFNPELPESGAGGRSDGVYRLQMHFVPASTAATTIVDASGTPLDGDRDGRAGGEFTFWFRTASAADTVYVDKIAPGTGRGDGSIGNPFKEIDDAVAAAAGKRLIRIVGNNGDELSAGGDNSGRPPLRPGASSAVRDPHHYYIGRDALGVPAADGATFNVPAGVTVMIDAGVVLRMSRSNIDVGSSSAIVSRAGAALQVLGTPARPVEFTSWTNNAVAEVGVGPLAPAGQWGGIVFREDSDAGLDGVFLNSLSHAIVSYGGGQVVVDSQPQSFSPIHIEDTRPALAFNTISVNAGAAIAATPNAFLEADGRAGPVLRGNRMLVNSVNGLLVNIRTEFGVPLDTLDVAARFGSTEVTYVLQENLVIAGGAGGYEGALATFAARPSGRLTIDPGVVVKLQNSRIELERGLAQLYAEGEGSQRVIFTSLNDNRFGAGGTFDTNGNQPDLYDSLNPSAFDPIANVGQWGGIVINAIAAASIDNAYLAFAGGQTPIEGRFDVFNPIEVQQGSLRLANSRLEYNADGNSSTDRNARGTNTAATIFVRGSQPVIVGNDFRENGGAVISINANSLSDVQQGDPGRQSGPLARFAGYDDNVGPLVRDNRISYSGNAGSAVAGMVIRGSEITVESVWDDTDIVHVLRDEIIVNNFHTATGLRLKSDADASLVVKLAGATAGFTASGERGDVDDRIGGSVQIVGQPGFPVVLTSLADDSVGASLDILGFPVNDTNVDGTNTTPQPGGWRSLRFLPLSNDRNVAVLMEAELAYTSGIDANGSLFAAQVLGVLAPNHLASSGNTSDTAQEKAGDENRRLGFEVHGAIAYDDAGDVDIYAFDGYAGSEVWIDIDKTSSSLDTMLELLDASGQVLARSIDAQLDAAQYGSISGAAAPLEKNDFNGGDFYTQNPRDAGMRVVLPGPGGVAARYFIRVRSQPAAVADAASHRSRLADEALVEAGQTSGRYELRVRLQQRDEKPGSTVRYADIRYPQVGIDVVGLPAHSPLVGETGENRTDDNGGFATAQQLGNLLTSDRGTISVAGAISSQTDVDWYSFTLTYEDLQVIGGLSDGGNTWATVFDIDYADGFRGDLTLSVFDSAGRLIYVGRDSHIDDDLPAAGQGNDFDDLSRGSFGVLDPFIGSAQLPAGTGGGGQTYYVAVSSNAQLPSAMDATFQSVATNPLIRLEPISSVRRIVDDRIDSLGYVSPDPSAPPPPPGSENRILPTTGHLIDISDATTLSAHVLEYTLADVVLYVSTDRQLYIADPMQGDPVTAGARSFPVGGSFTRAGDIDMRPDGRLFRVVGIANDTANVATLQELDAGTGDVLSSQGDGVANVPIPPVGTPPNPLDTWQMTSDSVQAMAIARTGVGQYVNQIYYSLVGTPSQGTDGAGSYLYRARTSGDAAGPRTGAGSQFSLRGRIIDDGSFDGSNVPLLGTASTTGMQFRWESAAEGLYGVSSNGLFYTINTATGEATILADFGPDLASAGDGFQGLATAPVNLEGGRYAGMFFALTNDGRLVCIDVENNQLLDNVFDTIEDGVAVANSRISNVMVKEASGSFQGLAFSPLDINLWHPTTYRSGDQGHGVNAAPDNSRTAEPGGTSMYFGLEQYRVGDSSSTTYAGGEQFGGSGEGPFSWHQELTSNPAIGNNFNLPGGARGSLLTGSRLDTGSFSLEDYIYEDKPTLYFNYFLESSGDTASVYITTGPRVGLTLVNGGTGYTTAPIVTLSPPPAGGTQATAEATVEDGVVTGFTITDPGSGYDSAPTVSLSGGGGSGATATAFIGDVWELVASIGGQAYPSASTRISINPQTQQIQSLYSSTGTWRQARIDIGEYAGESDLRLRFVFNANLTNNTGNGFFIDDIMVGLTERGEMVTGAASGQTDFFALPAPPVDSASRFVTQNLQGPYQLEVRRGTEYAQATLATVPNITIQRQFDTNDRLVLANPGGPLLGDSNVLRQQGQFLIENNIVSQAAQYGIRIDASRDTGADPDGNYKGATNAPASGVVRNLPVLNTSRLVPGVVVNNNIVAGSGTGGILFSGDPNTGNVPLATVPYGRIVNNTIYGRTGGGGGTGITVTENAAPTLLNNVFAELATGVSVDGSSAAATVIGTSAFYQVGQQVVGGTQSQGMTLQNDPFVNAAAGNFYPKDDAAVIDSSLGSLQDRPAFTVVTQPLGIPPSPIVAPDRDLFGQLRADDPEQASVPGLGSNVFKDRGAVERIDQTRPTARLVGPLDQGAADGEPEVDSVRIVGAQARSVDRFVLQLADVGVGIDKTSVRSDAVTLRLGGQLLVAGTDYFFQYNQNTDQIILSAVSVYGLGGYLIEITPSTNTTAGLRFIDRAGNPLLANTTTGTTSFSIDLEDVPLAPVSVVGVKGDGRVTLSWTPAGTASNPAISRYVIEYSVNGGQTWTAAAVQPTTTSATVTGLTNDIPHVFRVAAVNAIGTGGFSVPSVPVIPQAIRQAAAPRNLAANPGDATVALSWDLPSDDGGSDISDYVIEYRTSGSPTWLLFNDGTGVGRSATVTGLANGSSYDFRVAARTAFGSNGGIGLFAQVNSVTPRAVPGAPTAVQLVPAPGRLTASWTAPVSTGGANITDYAIEFSTNGGTTWTAFADGVSSAATAILTGLTNGTSHVVRVAARNVVGQGAWSSPSAASVPGTPATAPQNLQGTLGDQQVVLNWQTPSSAGDQPITDYQVDYRVTGSANWLTANDGIGTGTTATVAGLVNGTRYDFRVAAITGIATGAFSQTVAVTPARPAAPPTNLSLTPSSGSVQLAWTAPTDNGGSPVTDYTIEYRLVGAPAWTTANDGVATTPSAVVSGLANGSTYQFRVAARTSAGLGGFSTVASTVVGSIPAAPTTAVAWKENGGVLVAWNAVTPPAGMTISGYRVEYRRVTATDWTLGGSGSGSASSLLLPGSLFAQGVTYEFRVAAVANTGVGLYRTSNTVLY